MKKKKDQEPTIKSSSSEQTDQSPMPKDLLELGRLIVEELGLDPGVDTLGRWMAHYIAELIESVESATEEERADKLTVCAEAILRIWEHRRLLPDGTRPFENLEPVLTILASLDLTNNIPRYFRSQRAMVEEGEENSETRSWLKRISELDYTAKMLIRYCMIKAAETALDKSKKWVNAIEAIEEPVEQIDIKLFRHIAEEHELLQALDDRSSVQLQERIERLDEFMTVAEALIYHLRQQLKIADEKKGD